MKLKYFDHVPEELYTIGPDEVYETFGGPILIHIKGTNPDTIFISTLLHGNETTGFYAFQKILNDYKKIEAPPKSFIYLIGNPQAAQKDKRLIKDIQIDFNRIWAGGDSPEAYMAKEVTEYAIKHDVKLSIDLHNNTGNNPYYSCVNSEDKDFLALARIFSKKIIYFLEPHEVQCMAFSKFCPAITVEAGLSGKPEGIEYIYNKLNQVMEMNTIPYEQIDNNEFKFYKTTSRMKIGEQATIDFDFNPDSANDFSLIKDFDSHNFETVPVGTVMGYVKKVHPLFVMDNGHNNVFDEYFEVVESELRVKKAFFPSMFTMSIEVLKQDVLGYIMEDYSGKAFGEDE